MQQGQEHTAAFKEQLDRRWLPEKEFRALKKKQAEAAEQHRAQIKANKQSRVGEGRKHQHQKGPVGPNQRRQKGLGVYYEEPSTTKEETPALPKFTNIYEYSRFAPEEGARDEERVISQPVKQRRPKPPPREFGGRSKKARGQVKGETKKPNASVFVLGKEAWPSLPGIPEAMKAPSSSTTGEQQTSSVAKDTADNRPFVEQGHVENPQNETIKRLGRMRPTAQLFSTNANP